MDIRIKDMFVLIWTDKKIIMSTFLKNARIETNQNVQVEKELKNLDIKKIPDESIDNIGEFTVVKKDGKVIYKESQITAKL